MTHALQVRGNEGYSPELLKIGPVVGVLVQEGVDEGNEAGAIVGRNWGKRPIYNLKHEGQDGVCGKGVLQRAELV